MTFRFVNRVTALVTSTVSVSATTATLEAGAGALFPALGVGEVVQASFAALTGEHEIVQVTKVVGDVVTIVRGQEGTAPATFPSGSRLEVRLTAAVLQSFIQRTGDTMQGDLDMDGHAIKRAKFNSPVAFTTLHAQAIRATDVALDAPLTPTENAIVIPLNTNPNINARIPTIFGRPIVFTGMFDSIVFDAWIDVNHVPAWFKLCDGTLGTPDLRGKFIRGWIDTFGVGGEGGSQEDGWVATDLRGAHSHSGVTVTATLPGISVGGRGYHLDGSPGGTDFVGQNATMGSNGLHAHGIVADGNHQHLVNVLPHFYALARVMFKV